MTVTVAHWRGEPYLRAMFRLVWKLAALFALLLMPLGMAAPAASPAHRPASAVAMEHCPDMPSKDGKSVPSACVANCAAALPAASPAPPEPALLGRSHVERVDFETPSGLHPETATPPPRRS